MFKNSWFHLNVLPFTNAFYSHNNIYTVCSIWVIYTEGCVNCYVSFHGFIWFNLIAEWKIHLHVMKRPIIEPKIIVITSLEHNVLTLNANECQYHNLT